MAVSGGKSPGSPDSLLKGSTEYFDVCCDPCLLDGQNTGAEGFCLDCQENLCKTCLKHHNKSKASRHHRIKGHTQGRSTQTPVQIDSSVSCTEPCQVHQNECIKYFCPIHEFVGCTVCMTLDHRTCKIDYIPDICNGITKSQEFQKTLQDVTEAVERVEILNKKSKSVKIETKTGIEEAIKEIKLFQKKVNERLEELKQTMIRDAQTERSIYDKKVTKILNTTDQVFSSLKSFQKCLQDIQSNNLYAKAFTVMKQSQSKMKTLDLKPFEDEVLKHRTKFVFEPNTDLEHFLSLKDCLGKLGIFREHVVSEQTVSFKSLNLTNDINVRTVTDERICDITSCAMLSAGKLLVADRGNNKLKLVDIEQQVVVAEKRLDSNPSDIAVLKQNKVALTLPFKQRILFIAVSGHLSVIKCIPVKRACYGITYHQNHIYVLCQCHNNLLVLDLQGTVLRDISLQNLNAPSRIAFSHDGNTIYVSDWRNSIVARLTVNGEMISMYENDKMRVPVGMHVVKDGSLIVCCRSSSNIHHISSDLNHGKILIEGVSGSKAICFYPDEQKIIVGRESCDNVSVFKVK